MAGQPEGDLSLLRLQMETMLAISPEGRVLRQGPPDNGPGPRVFFAGCACGNLIRFGQGMDDQSVVRLEALVQDQPYWTVLDNQPAGLKALIEQTAPARPRPRKPGKV